MMTPNQPLAGRPSPMGCRTPRWRCLGLALLTAGLWGCRHIGPGTVAPDRLDYGASIAESWKQQTLLNIIKLRYMDLPVFVDVASIVSGYSLQTNIGLTGTLYPNKESTGDFGQAAGQAVYTDRPTITYVPLTGEKFLRGLLTPIDPKNIFFLLQSGYPADFILALTIESLNGLRNRSTAAGATRDAEPDFVRALQLLREVQATGGFGMRVEEDKAKNATAIVFIRPDDASAESAAKAAEILRLLKLPADQAKYKLVYSPMRGGDGELAVNSRSIIQIMGAFASYAEMPEEDLKDGRAVPMPPAPETKEGQRRVSIHCSKDKPTDAFAAVRYRSYWFWIDNRDWYSKRAFTAIMFFFTLADTGESAKLPLVTIPAQ